MGDIPFRVPPQPKYLLWRVIQNGHDGSRPNPEQAKAWIDRYLGSDTIIIEDIVENLGTEAFREWLVNAIDYVAKKYPQASTGGMLVEWIGESLLEHLLIQHPMFKLTRAKAIKAEVTSPFELRSIDQILIGTFVAYHHITEYSPTLEPLDTLP